MKNNYKGAIVWITGASAGIGEALSYVFNKNGAIVVLSARQENELQRVKNNCANPENCFILPLDLEKQSEFKQLVDIVIQKFGRIDTLINNAGVSQRSTVENSPMELYRKIMEINFFGTVALTKTVLPYMLNAGKGQLIVNTSIVGKFGFPLRSAYSASKHALQGFFETLRAENVKNNIEVNIIIPGRIKTKISINALNNKLLAENIMDPGLENGLDANVAALRVFKKLQLHKKEIPVGKTELLMLWFRRFCPPLFYYLAAKISAR